ncbi:MAG: ABC transporter ATP-binding protein [Actinomycetota bacterium]|nr:ABC transporter ATP-binding protein [Actinomycetota bacterium]
MTDAVVTRGLTKRFRGGQVAVADLDLDVPQGSVFGFLGPNGSGKTTTIRMLLGLAAPTKGNVQLLGEAMPRGSAAALPRVGALIEGPACYPFLSGEANLVRLDMADRTADPRTRAARVDSALERVGLLAARRKRYKAYSLGMRQRLGLAAALLRPRDLLVLDEPTNGLDPQGTREIRALIRAVADDGATVFLSSHLLAEVEQVCTHAAVLSHGRLVANGTVDSLRAAAAGRLVVSTPDTDRAAATLRRLGIAEVSVEVTAQGGQVSGLADSVLPEVACAALVARGVRVQSLALQRPSLEEAFVALTGEGFDVAE